MKQRILAIFIVLLFVAVHAAAATITTAQSGNWSAPSTWTGNLVPASGDGVIIDAGFTVTLDVPNASCLSLQLGGTLAGVGKGTIVFTGGSQLTVLGLVTVGASNNSGSITMTSGGTLICEGFLLNSLGTWTPGTGTVEFTATNTLPNNGITSFANLIIAAGTTNLNANLTVTGNLVIHSGGVLDCGLRQLSLGGDWINNGTFTGNTGTVIFDKNGNQSITGSGINNFNLIRVNMGTSSANTLEVLSTNFSAPDAFLALSNGTFKVSGTFALASTFILGPLYNIQPTAGLWINNPNVTITAQAGGVSVRGILRLSAGTYNIGTATDHNLDYVAGSSIIVEGGTLNIAGHLGRNSPASTTSYSQSGGVVTVVTQGSTDITNAGFDLGAAGSSFTMSGGTLVVANATSNATDYLNVAGSTSVTGGTVQIGNAATLNGQTFRIQSSAPIGNLLISNATVQVTKPKAQLVNSSITLTGGLTIQAGTTFNANGLNVTLGGDWFNSGLFTAGPLVTFSGPGAQSLTTPGGEVFSGLTVNKSGGLLSLNSSITVNGGFTFTQGTVAVGANTLTLNGAVSGTGTLTSSSSGTVSYNQGSAGQNVLAANYGTLFFSDFNKTLPATGAIGIANVFTPGAAVGHNVTGSTIDFNGGPQNIPSFPYNNLLLSGTGVKSGSGALTVNGNFTCNAGIQFSGTTALTLSGTTHTNGGTVSAATIAVGPAAVFTNNGTVTTTVSLTGAGSLTQGAGATLNVGGTIDVATLNAFALNNTVTYSGVAQTVRNISYHTLNLSGSGSTSVSGVSTINGNFSVAGTVATSATLGLTIGGNFTIGAGASFDAGAFSHALKGNMSNSGTFTAGTSTMTFNGTGPQTITGSTFNSLVIDNASGVSMLSDETIAGALTVTTGNLAIGAHALTLNGALNFGTGSLIGGTTSNLTIGGPGSALTLPTITVNALTVNRSSGVTLSGDVTVDGSLTIANGTLNTGVKSILLGPSATLTEVAGQPILGTVSVARAVTASSGTESFGNIGVDVVLNGVPLGNTTVVRKTGTASTGAGHSSIKRYFDISPATNSGLQAGLVFHYDTSEVNAQNPNIFELYRSRDGGTSWNNLGGTVNTTSRTISLAGINDFSRWTVADTSNRIGTTAAPAVASINPSTKNAGDAAFTLTVNGTDFINGKSTVLFNGAPRTTVFVSTGQLTASIPATDLLLTGVFPVTVVTVGGGTSNAINFSVSAGAPSSVSIETAADGSGSVVPPQSLVSGSSITVYAVTRDSLKNFKANVVADSWKLQNTAGGVVAGDLVPVANGKSAVFTGRLVGSASINAVSGVLTTVNSGLITVTAGSAKKINVETLADGSGNAVPAETLAVGSSIKVYAITRDSLNNFVSNIVATSWSLQNSTGGFVASDLIPAVDNKSAVFSAHAAGSANISATSGVLAAISSGKIMVMAATAVEASARPMMYELRQNYPNPFNPTTNIAYSVADRQMTTLTVYDALGREVATLVNEVKEPGTHVVQFNAAGFASGVYFYRVQAGKFSETKRLVLLK